MEKETAITLVDNYETLNAEEIDAYVVTDKPTIANSLISLLGKPVLKERMYEALGGALEYDDLPENPTMQDCVSAALVVKASMGDVKAFEVIRDTIGEKPIERVEQDTVVRVMLPDSIQEYGD